ncbi:hypothetical protein WR25_13886 [Diploscapter pachys]|uniref:Uncharacterized protein n=1 Tax=Diploscapter pachys TaxID=2018661 RepID=A0A2A2JCD1_9BILA|nr:hypothetical protein WR25_13886 [Diploscapter pachys]
MRCALLLLFLCLIVAVINAKPTTEAAEIDGDVGRPHQQKTTAFERGRNREQKDVKKIEYDDNMTLFGYTFELPEWVIAIRDGIKAAYNTARGYLSGEEEFQTTLFGQNITIRADMPTSVDDFLKDAKGLYNKLHKNEVARVMLTLYLNLTVFVLICLVLFIKQIKLCW